MGTAAQLVDAFERIRDAVHPAVSGLTAEELAFRPDDEANPVSWLVWHLTRIQDDHVSALAGTGQSWVEDDWAGAFGLPYDVADTGYGHDPAETGAVVVPASLLLDYFESVHARTVAFVAGLAEEEFDRIVDTRWDPPVTLGARLVSVIADDLQHVGQAAYVRGIAQRRS